MLKSDDLDILRAHPKILSYLFEKVNYTPCARLIFYRFIAQKMNQTSEEVQGRSISKRHSTQKLSADTELQELMIANFIMRMNDDLGGRLVAIGMGEADKDRICKLFARLVIGHENDKDCGIIIAQLKNDLAGVDDVEFPKTCG